MGKPIKDMVGQRFGRLYVTGMATKPATSKNTGIFWNCICDCGNHAVVYGTYLRNGQTKSCGCAKSDASRKRMTEMRLKETGTIEDRFFARFKKVDSGCWQWQAHSDKDGYGILPANGPAIRAHRFSYEHHIGVIPDRMVICHKCDNPGCVNPEHLFIGTPKDNNRDALKKRRNYIGEKNGRSKLTKDDVLKIKKDERNAKDIAKQYGVTRSQISGIKRGDSWKSLN